MERTKYIDKRKWPEYNEKLVRRGEMRAKLDADTNFQNHSSRI
jgi:hypothetical protein